MCCKNNDGKLPIDLMIKNDAPFQRFEKLLENDILHQKMYDSME